MRSSRACTLPAKLDAKGDINDPGGEDWAEDGLAPGGLEKEDRVETSTLRSLEPELELNSLLALGFLGALFPISST